MQCACYRKFRCKQITKILKMNSKVIRFRFVNIGFNWVTLGSIAIPYVIYHERRRGKSFLQVRLDTSDQECTCMYPTASVAQSFTNITLRSSAMFVPSLVISRRSSFRPHRSPKNPSVCRCAYSSSAWMNERLHLALLERLPC